MPPDYRQKGETTMLVKAKWNVKGMDGWHMTGEVFNTSEDFGDAVEMLENPAGKPARKPAEEVPVKEEEKAEKPKSASRRRTTAK